MKNRMDGWRIMKLMGLVWILALLVLVLGWENRTRGYVWKTVNEESAVILREMPSLEITEAEYAVENKLWEVPEIQEVVGKAVKEGYGKLSERTVKELFQKIIPENAEFVSVEVGPGDVLFRYTVLNLTTSLCYYQSKEAPVIKMINVSNSRDDISKSLLYINYGNKTFEKQKQERIWFDQTRKLLGLGAEAERNG